MSEVKIFKYNTVPYTGSANFYSSSTVETSIVTPIQNIIENGGNGETAFNIGKYSIFEIANWFLLKSPMTHKKIQKLCYYAQAWYYALKNARLEDADFQAWVHGPVAPSLYERFKSFGFDTIKIQQTYSVKIEADDISFLDDIWETYGGYTGNALEALSHREMPWLQARAGYAPNERCSIVISPDIMRSYYLSIYRK